MHQRQMDGEKIEERSVPEMGRMYQDVWAEIDQAEEANGTVRRRGQHRQQSTAAHEASARAKYADGMLKSNNRTMEMKSDDNEPSHRTILYHCINSITSQTSEH